MIDCLQGFVSVFEVNYIFVELMWEQQNGDQSENVGCT